MYCPSLDKPRTNFFNCISSVDVNFTSLSDTEKFSILSASVHYKLEHLCRINATFSYYSLKVLFIFLFPSSCTSFIATHRPPQPGHLLYYACHTNKISYLSSVNCTQSCREGAHGGVFCHKRPAKVVGR